MTRVSVVIPTYNNEAYLLDALNSVFAQTHAPHEIIVVDDGSTDGTRALLEPYMARIRYHHQPNQGLAVARNVGLGLATGDWLTYLDGDDAWLPGNLAVKVAVVERFPETGGVFSEFSIFDATGETHARGTNATFPFFERTGWTFDDVFAARHTLEVSGVGPVTVRTGNVFERLFHGNFILPTTMVFHRERALACGQFRTHMRTQQDYEYWLRFSRQHPFAHADVVCARYRRHAEQLTNFKNIERILRAVEEIIVPYEGEMRAAGRGAVYDKRRGELDANFAKMHIRKEEPAEARRRVGQALKRAPLSPSLYLLLAASFVPPALIAGVKRAMRGGKAA
jgi:glycosyltransferase involved in cell wall biosynthesis